MKTRMYNRGRRIVVVMRPWLSASRQKRPPLRIAPEQLKVLVDPKNFTVSARPCDVEYQDNCEAMLVVSSGSSCTSGRKR